MPAQNEKASAGQNEKIQPRPDTVQNILVRNNGSMGRLMLYFDPTGFLFVGPRTGLQLNIARSTFLDMHHRFSRFGIIYNAIATGVSSDYVQQINSMAIGAGLCHYFTKPIAQSVRLYTGICGEYGWGTTHNNVYDYDIKKVILV